MKKKNSLPLFGQKKSKSKKPTNFFLLRNVFLIYFNFLIFAVVFSFILIKNYFYLFFLNFLKIEVLKKQKPSPKIIWLNIFNFLGSFSLIFLLFFQIFQVKNNLKRNFIIQQEIKNQEFNLNPSLLVSPPPLQDKVEIKLKNTKDELNKINVFLKKQPNNLQLLKNKIIINQYLKNNQEALKVKNLLDN